jgi:hypothetical protein
MAGLPSYRVDPGKYFRDLNKTSVDAFTADNTRDPIYRPWSTLAVMDGDASRWRTSVSSSWTTFQAVGGPNSHPRYTLYFGVVAPAGGSQVQGLWMDLSTILFGPIDIPSTAGLPVYYAVTYDLSEIPNGPDHYEAFYFYTQARSISPGNGTALSTFGSWGVEPTHTAGIPV